MKPLVHKSDQWDYVKRILFEAQTSASNHLLRLLPNIKQMIERDRFGQLLFVSDEKHPYRFFAAAAITCQCQCAKVYLQVVSKECPSQETGKKALSHAITQFARDHHCSLVFVQIPDSGTFQTEHEYYSERANMLHSTPCVDLGTLTYVLPLEKI